MRKVCGKHKKESSRIQKEQKKHCTREKKRTAGWDGADGQEDNTEERRGFHRGAGVEGLGPG